MKLMTVSMTVSASTSAARAALRDALTASAYCLLVASAMKRGILAAEVAACSAALQLVSSSSLALRAAFCASARESWRRKAMKMREMMG